MPVSTPQFDYAKGQVFLQDGIIYYSPNCSRSVLLPIRDETGGQTPFSGKRLAVSMFKRPVWWTDVYGWLSFIPLSPSYTSTPFEPFRWTPHIEELYWSKNGTDAVERRYRMALGDISIWKEREELLVGAVERIRIWHKIDGNLPPKPSSFHYDQPHRTRASAERMITLSRDWFTVWMGFASYLLAQTKRLPANKGIYGELELALGNPDETPSPYPLWRQQLQKKHGYSEHWLDGLDASTVSIFNTQTARAGVVFQWTELDKTRPPIEWFDAHHISLFFAWSAAEEEAISRDRTLAYLRPPTHMLQNALTLLFRTPNFPLAGIVMRHYFRLSDEAIDKDLVKLLRLKHASSVVLEFTTKLFIDQAHLVEEIDGTAEAEDHLRSLLAIREHEQRAAVVEDMASLPVEAMREPPENGHETGDIYDDWRDFMRKREIRQKERVRFEKPTDKQRRESREKNPEIRSASIYIWQTIQSSGGKPVYMRVPVITKNKDDVYSSFGPSQRLYNAMDNAWDLCKEFGEPEIEVTDADYSEADEHDYKSDDNTYIVVPLSHFYTDSVDENDQHEATDGHVNMDTDGLDTWPFSKDVMETATYGYGYVSPLPGATIGPSSTTWETTLLSFGFVENLSQFDLPQTERNAITRFFLGLTSPSTSPMPPGLDDLSDSSRLALSHVFDFTTVHRPSPDLFVFSEPRSLACDWLLGVHSPAIALYICRLINSDPGKHTIATVASWLLERGVEFRTLRTLSFSPRQTTVSQPYKATHYRFIGYKFTPNDFDACMLQAQSILVLPQGRAAILKGGIIGRIARDFLSLDATLDGPSVEVLAHRVGYMADAGSRPFKYCDDELTEQEIAMVCGTYTLLTEFKGQESVKSWFPPPRVWAAHQHGGRWIEWTERNESWYQKRIEEIRLKGGQPLSVTEWRTRLKGQKINRIFYQANEERARAFLDKVLPVEVVSSSN